MDQGTGGILSRVSERVLGYVALALIVAGGIALWQMGPDGRNVIWQAIWRTTVWLIIAAVLPWVSRLFITRITAVGSNWAGGVLIGVLTLVNLIAGLVLMGGFPAGGWAWVAALAALAVAGTYNYLVTEYLAEQAGI